MSLDLSENAEANAARAAMINALATGHLLPPPPVIPSAYVPLPEIHEAQFEPGFAGSVPWQDRVFPAERQVDLGEVRAELGRAIKERAAAAAELAAVAGELARADALIAEVAAAHAARAEEADARIAASAAALRDWLGAGSVGDRPAAPASVAAPREEAELEAARMARAGVAADHDRARLGHAATVETADRARRTLLTGEAQEISVRYLAALAVLSDIEADGRALLGLTIAGSPAIFGLVRERLPASPAPASGDATAARWAAYAGRLNDDPDARLADD
jgi:hypothetical protein